MAMFKFQKPLTKQFGYTETANFLSNRQTPRPRLAHVFLCHWPLPDQLQNTHLKDTSQHMGYSKKQNNKAAECRTNVPCPYSYIILHISTEVSKTIQLSVLGQSLGQNWPSASQRSSFFCLNLAAATAPTHASAARLRKDAPAEPAGCQEISGFCQTKQPNGHGYRGTHLWTSK